MLLGAVYGIFAMLLLLAGEAILEEQYSGRFIPWTQLLILYCAIGAVAGIITGHFFASRQRFAAPTVLALMITAIGAFLLHRETLISPFSSDGFSFYLQILTVSFLIWILAWLLNCTFVDNAGRGGRIIVCAMAPALPTFARGFEEAIRMEGKFSSVINHFSQWPALILPLGQAMLVVLLAWFFRRRRISEAIAPAALLIAAVAAHIHPSLPNHVDVVAPQVDRLNVVILVCDSLRADRTGIEGYVRNTTPALNSLAESSTVYHRAISSHTFTAVSVTSILTGLSPVEHKLVTLDAVDPHPEQSLPGRLRSLGYKTGGWMWEEYYEAGGLTKTAFDEFSRGSWEMRDSSFLEGHPDRWVFGYLTASLFGWTRQTGFRVKGEYNRLQANQIYDFIKRAKNQNQPFFVYAHDLRLHMPSTASPKKGRLWSKTASPRDVQHFWSVWGEWKPNTLPQGELLDVLNAFRNRYDDAARSFDDFLDEFRIFLREEGLDTRTLIIVTADHGEPLGDENIVVRMPDQITRGLVWVPLVLYDPRHSVRRDDTAPISSAEIAGLIYEKLNLSNDRVRPALAMGGVQGEEYVTDGRYIIRQTSGLGPWIAFPGEALPPPPLTAMRLQKALADCKEKW